MRTLRGVVAFFDERRGDGSVLGDDLVPYYFHCVEILDGSRIIAPGTRVTGLRRPGLMGRDELGEIQSVDD